MFRSEYHKIQTAFLPMKAEDMLEDFLLESGERFQSNDAAGSLNRWIEPPDDTIRVYIRRSKRLVLPDRRFTTVLDIANVTVDLPGQGRFTRFLEFVEYLRPYEGIFIENVLNPRFLGFFYSRDYIDVPGLHPPCVVKLWDN